jgi:hypothetical protein
MRQYASVHKDKDDTMAVDDNNTKDKDKDKDATEEAEADDPLAPPLSLFKFLLDHGQIESFFLLSKARQHQISSVCCRSIRISGDLLYYVL